MPRADFYLIDKPRFREQPLLLVCELAKKAFASQQPTLILARDHAQAEALDELLWAFDDDALFEGGPSGGTARAHGGYVYAQYRIGKQWQPGIRFDYLHGGAWEQRGSVNAALEEFEKALVLDPLNLELHKRFWALKKRHNR